MLFLIVIWVLFQVQLLFSQCPERCSCSGDAFVFVDCCHSALTSIPTEDLDDKVISLDLADNRISYLKDNVIGELGVPLLRYLDLNNNSIKGIGKYALFGVPELRLLDVSWNRITFLEPEVFNFVPNLEMLLLSYNPEMKLSYEMQCYNLQGLKILLMDHCALGHIPENFFGGMPKLEHLDLANNNIKTLPSNVLLNTRNLLELNLRHNLIESLNATVLLPVTKLKVFETQGNPWNCDCNMFRLIQLCARRQLAINITCGLLPGGRHSDSYSTFQQNCTESLKTRKTESSMLLVDIAVGGTATPDPGSDDHANNDFHKSNLMSLDYVVKINVIMVVAVLMASALGLSFYVTKRVVLYLNNKYTGEYVLV